MKANQSDISKKNSWLILFRQVGGVGQEVKSISVSERGVALLEVLTTVPIFMFLLISLVDCALIGYKSLTAQFVASRVVRYGAVLDIASPVIHPDGSDDRGIMMEAYMVALERSLGLKTSDEKICGINPAAGITSLGSCNSRNYGGAPGQYVYTRVNISHEAMLGLFTVNLRGEAIARNERIFN